MGTLLWVLIIVLVVCAILALARGRFQSDVARNRNRVCLEPGCPTITATPRCPTHTTRPTYGADHRNVRRQWTPIVATGTVPCWRCGALIDPGAPWDMGHDDDNVGEYAGPEHAHCGRSAGGSKSHE